MSADAAQDTPSLDVAIVGAGPAGIGMAAMLARLGGLDIAVLEAEDVGATFRRWPKQTRFITPSFFSNPFGLPDLNALTASSSPALSSQREHPSGDDYADYLLTLVRQFEIPVAIDCPVEAVAAQGDEGFWLTTPHGRLHARFLIWATGEFGAPDAPFEGAELGLHYAQVRDWQDLDGEQQVVVGGYESGMDAAVNLVALGGRVRLLMREPSWGEGAPRDPSLALSPYSQERLAQARSTGRLEIVTGADIVSLERRDESYWLHAADGRRWSCPAPPVLGTGFASGGGARQIEALWEWSEGGEIRLTEQDESTRTPGLFLVGPQVRHDEAIYCFIYKFRQRFTRVAGCIATRLKREPAWLDEDGQGLGPFDDDECCQGCLC